MGDTPKTPSFVCALVSGGLAGTSVDVALFPLDTIKTRLQSPNGFFAAGGFRGIYNGLSAAAAGSAPGAALFFSTYETVKPMLETSLPEGYDSVAHMTAASCGEVAACLVRVPTEIVKQRMQAGLSSSLKSTVTSAWAKEGFWGFYTGYGTTVLREIPFACIQFPLYEQFKKTLAAKLDRPLASYEGASCGSVAGGIAAGLTTPLDVIKTRLMLGKDRHGIKYTGFTNTYSRLMSEEGPRVFLSGIGPRVMWISIGGFVFFGTYEKSKQLLIDVL